MRTGQYDGVSASGDATTRLIEGGDVDPVNTDLIPNYEDVFDALKDQPFNSVDGQMYGVPHGRGSNLLMYDPAEVKPAPDVLERRVRRRRRPEREGDRVRQPDLHRRRGAVSARARARPRDQDPYELDEEQFHAAIDLLKEQKEHIGEYWSDYTKEIQAFANGDSTVGTTWQVSRTC